jgi:hypothetical protein
MSRNHAIKEAAGGAAVDALRTWFSGHPIAELDDLRRTLGGSTRTVFRVLRRAGYHSSFSHAGRYYTLADTPRFDERGLWFHEHVGFSRHGTLRSTLVRLIEQSPAGNTHDELSAVVRLRVHDTLRSLVAADLIGRERVEALFVYLAAAPAVAGAQLARRREMLAAHRAAPPPPVDATRLIEVLLGVIRKPHATAAQIAQTLRLRDLAVSDEQVEMIFTHYSLGKKTARSPSTRSRR